MAFFSNIISFLFFTTLSLSLQIHARDSPFFFSKVTHANNNDINGKEIASIPNKEEPVNKPADQQEPMFIPETDNSYGLYGHETTYQPYKTESEDDMSNNKDSYGENQNEELGNTKYTQVYNSVSNQKEKNHKYGDQREGMSDTRFMEGGKYFCGVGSDHKYNPTFYGDSTRGPKSKSWENYNMGYFGRPNNHPHSYYGNSNAMEGYLQNQEFEGNKDDEFEP